MMIIAGISVDDDVAGERFSCDLSRCLGGCCTLRGGRGAPLLEEEVGLLHRYYPVLREYLSAEGEKQIRHQGMTEETGGDHATTCIEDRDCVFVVYDGPVATCAIEKCFLEGRIPWRKPLSCHLFPLRYTGGEGGTLRYERIEECRPGRVLGRSQNRLLRDFTGDALIRRFGREWYGRFLAACADRDRMTEHEQ